VREIDGRSRREVDLCSSEKGGQGTATVDRRADRFSCHHAAGRKIARRFRMAAARLFFSGMCPRGDDGRRADPRRHGMGPYLSA